MKSRKKWDHLEKMKMLTQKKLQKKLDAEAKELKDEILKKILQTKFTNIEDRPRLSKK